MCRVTGHVYGSSVNALKWAALVGMAAEVAAVGVVRGIKSKLSQT